MCHALFWALEETRERRGQSLCLGELTFASAGPRPCSPTGVPALEGPLKGRGSALRTLPSVINAGGL